MQPIETSRAHCVDPETLAAWVDGGLPAPEAAEVEVHLSTCARCQAILAALSASEPDAIDAAPAVVLPFWSRRPVQWAAAALAAAASISLWTMNRPQSEPAPITAAENVVVQAPAITTPSPTPPATSPTPAPPARRATTPRSASKEIAADRSTVAQAPPAPVASPPAAAPVLPAPPPSPPQPTPQTVSLASPTAARQEAMFTPRAEVAISRPAIEVIAASDQNAPLNQDAIMPRSAGRGGGGGRAAVGNFSAPVRRPPVRWRVNGMTVERSVDSGQTWEPVTLDPPFTLNSGSAPYQNVCWLVGQDGVVFRTTNGTSFERMTPPDAVHLVAVMATDAQRAFVRAVDGRVFDTTDGGVTWTLRK